MKNKEILLWVLVSISIVLSVFNLIRYRVSPSTSSAALLQTPAQLQGNFNTPVAPLGWEEPNGTNDAVGTKCTIRGNKSLNVGVVVIINGQKQCRYEDGRTGDIGYVYVEDSF